MGRKVHPVSIWREETMKIKFTQPGYESYTGAFGDVEFVDGVSVDDVTDRQAQRIGNLVQIETEDGKNPSSAQVLLDSQGTLMSEKLDEKTVAPEAVKVKSYTRQQLSDLADEGGIEALRKIAEPLGLKSRSIAQLVDQILAATDTNHNPAATLIGSSKQPALFEIAGKTVTLGTIVNAAFTRFDRSTQDWNDLPEEIREQYIADELTVFQAKA
jgi:hypothetical protein